MYKVALSTKSSTLPTILYNSRQKLQRLAAASSHGYCDGLSRLLHSLLLRALTELVLFQPADTYASIFSIQVDEA